MIKTKNLAEEFFTQSKISVDIAESFLVQFAFNLEYYQKMTDKIHELCKYTSTLKTRLKNNISKLSDILENKEIIAKASSEVYDKIDAGIRLNKKVIKLLKYFDYKLREQNIVISNQNKEIVEIECELNILEQKYNDRKQT